MRRPAVPVILLSLAAALAFAPAAPGQQKAAPEGGAFSPSRVEATDQRIATLKLPPGFSISVAARGIDGARMLLVLPDGSLLVSQPNAGMVRRLFDRDGDGRYDEQQFAVEGLSTAHGMAFHRQKLYLAGVVQILAADLGADGKFGEWRKIADLPRSGSHSRRTLAVGPADGRLYVTVGSTCNNCEESNPEHAAVLSMRLDGGDRRIFAKGLRNTMGFGFHPATRELWGMDHGSDWRGDDKPPEELNRIEVGKDYGWPYCYMDRRVDIHSDPPRGKTREQYCAATEPAALGYQAHSAPIGMAFYDGALFPAEYRGDAFVAMQGSWNRKVPVGHSVVRIRFQSGKPLGFVDFLTGFLSADGQTHFGTPAGLAVDRDGSLLISDDSTGLIYRVRYAK